MARSNKINSYEAKELLIDLVEDILVRLDGEDLIRCKSVCKSWLSLISSSRFVKNHLDNTCNKDYNNHELGHRRIIMPTNGDKRNDGKTLYNYECYDTSDYCIIGSSNGLVCFSISIFNAQVVVTNPLTREVKKLQTAPEIPESSMIPDRMSLCWGFGYDSFTNDYKVVMGINTGKGGTLFRVLSLKSNIWKVTSQVKYVAAKYVAAGPIGILWNGMLHWFMKDRYYKRVILSFNLSREEFKETSQPHDSRYVCDWSNSLGIVEGCLCIFRNHLPYQRWVMKNNNDKQSWELLPNDCEMNKYDVAHVLKRNNWYLCDKGDEFFSKDGKYIASAIYVPSLISPHLNGKPKKKRHTKNNKRSAKVVSRYDVISRFFRFSHDILKRKRQVKNRKMNGISSGYRTKYPV